MEFLLFLAVLSAIAWLLSWPFRKYSAYKNRKEQEAKKREAERRRREAKKERAKTERRRRKYGIYVESNSYPLLMVSESEVDESRVQVLDNKISHNKVGRSESTLYNRLRSRIDKNRIHFGCTKLYHGQERHFRTLGDVEYHLEKESKKDYYYPDIAYINSTKNIYIDIEIDEPFYFKDGERKACHYKFEGRRKDLDRDNEFLNQGWNVIRLAEEQVIEEPNKCVQYILDCIKYINFDRGGRRRPNKKNYSGPEPTQTWSIEEALSKSRHI
jgi:hypothetical protein